MEELRVPLEGLDRDTQDLQRKEGAYIFAYNAATSGKSGNSLALQNESATLEALDFGDFQVVGKKYISEYSKHLVCLTNNITSKIALVGFVDIQESDYDLNEYCYNCHDKTEFSTIPVAKASFEVLVEASCLQFSVNYPVDVQYKLTNCTLNIYFRDGYNENRYLYFDVVGSTFHLQNQFKVGYKKDCDGETFTNQLNCVFAGWYQKYESPIISTQVENGGLLKEGVYQVLFSWATSKGIALSSYKALTNPIPIFVNTVKVATNNDTTKGLRISIDMDTDVIYQFYNLVIVETINNVSSYRLITLPKDTTEYFLTDTTTLIRLSDNEIFQQYPFYKSSDYISVANGYFIQGGLKEFEKFNLQRVAAKIELGWETVTLKEGDYGDPSIAQNYRSYLRDEVYSIGIVFELNNGEETPVYHIPSRTSRAGEKRLVIDPTNTDPNSANKNVEFWRLYNTGTVTTTPHFGYNKLNPQTYERGDFAYWESTDKYPNNREIWGDLCNQPIRHHKFPDNSVTNHHAGKNMVFNTDYITPVSVPSQDIYPIGIYVKSSISNLLDQAVTDKIITQEQRNRIVRYKIVRGNRFGNRSIQAKGWIYNTREYEKDGTVYRFPNYPYNDLRPDTYLARNDTRSSLNLNLRNQSIVADNKPYYTFHSPNTHFTNQSLGSVLKLETETYGTAKGKFAEVQEEAEHKLLTQRHYNLVIIIASVIARAYQPSEANMGASSNSIGQGVGTAAGAAIGSIIPGIGTAIGATLGGMLGGLIGSVTGKDNDRLKAGPRAIMWLAQTEKLLELITLSTKYWQYHYQWQSSGKYFAFKPLINDSNKIYKLENWRYLSPEGTTVPTKQGSLLFNNWERESSVFLETDRAIINPSVVDNSRNTGNDLFLISGDGSNLKFVISSFYASIKSEVRNQYGSIFGIRYLSTGSRSYLLNERPTVFGGDTFINAFAIKRKHRFFNSSTFQFPNGSDIYYEDLSNAGYPIHWFNTRNVDVPDINLLAGLTFLPNLTTTINSIEKTMEVSNAMLAMSGTKNTIPGLARVLSLGILSLFNKKENLGDKLVGEFMEDISEFFQTQLLSPDKYYKAPRYNLDLPINDSGSNLSSQGARGRIYLYSYGVPTYICESDINIDLRYAQDTGARDFYPNQSNLDIWLQHKNVPFGTDNYYFYNNTYSKQPHENTFVVNDINFKPYDECQVYYPNRVIYSLQGAELDNNDLRDNWLVNKALDYYDFGLEDGLLKGIHPIENDKVLVMFEDGMRMYAAYVQIQTDQDNVQINNGAMFRSKPISFAKTDYGYYGSQHNTFISTEYGHVSIDAKRGHIFILGSNGQMTDEITRYGLRKWFAENLPFQISRYFPVDIDNQFKGIGLHMVYDSLLKRLLITKLDYKPKRKGILYNPDQQTFLFNGKEIKLNDPLYFYDLSWTISYDFEAKKFISWHSYKPNYYLGENNRFFSNNENKLWVHNATNKLYQQVYGKQVDFVIDGFAKPNVQKTILKSVSFATQGIQYLNDFDFRYTNVTFEEAEIYNEKQHSGVLKLEQVNRDNLGERNLYPINTPDYSRVILDTANDEYSFNQFNDKSINAVPFYLLDPAHVFKRLNPESVNYFKSELSCDRLKSPIHFVRLTNKTNSTNNIIVKYIKLEHNGGLRG